MSQPRFGSNIHDPGPCTVFTFRHYFIAGSHSSLGFGYLEEARFLVGEGRGLFDHGHGSDEVQKLRNGNTGYTIVLHSTERLNAVIGISGDFLSRSCSMQYSCLLPSFIVAVVAFHPVVPLLQRREPLSSLTEAKLRNANDQLCTLAINFALACLILGADTVNYDIVIGMGGKTKELPRN